MTISLSRNWPFLDVCVTLRLWYRPQMYYKEKQGISIFGNSSLSCDKSYASPSLYTLHAAHKEKWMSGQWEKGILMASFDSWQNSGLTPNLPLMGGRDPGGTFVQALRLWHFREKWNYESNLAKQCVCALCVSVVRWGVWGHGDYFYPHPFGFLSWAQTAQRANRRPALTGDYGNGHLSKTAQS